jgi:hypothetical protein
LNNPLASPSQVISPVLSIVQVKDRVGRRISGLMVTGNAVANVHVDRASLGVSERGIDSDARRARVQIRSAIVTVIVEPAPA